MAAAARPACLPCPPRLAACAPLPPTRAHPSDPAPPPPLPCRSPAGTFQDTTASTPTCTRCTAGFWAPAASFGGSNADACTACPAGTYQDSEGCVPCPDGMISVTNPDGNAVCTPW